MGPRKYSRARVAGQPLNLLPVSRSGRALASCRPRPVAMDAPQSEDRPMGVLKQRRVFPGCSRPETSISAIIFGAIVKFPWRCSRQLRLHLLRGFDMHAITVPVERVGRPGTWLRKEQRAR